jgi:Sortase domain
VAAVAALGLGGALLGFAECSHSGPPSPSPNAARPAAVRSTPAPGKKAALPLDASVPVRVDVSQVGIHARVEALGLNSDGSVAVPPLSEATLASWYDKGPTPGQQGPAVILGHVDTKRGPAAFFELGRVRPGDRVDVTRRDGVIAVFDVDSVESSLKADFPTRRVYGDLGYAGLRLITCGGAFDGHSYLENTIVYAHLLSSHR